MNTDRIIVALAHLVKNHPGETNSQLVHRTGLTRVSSKDWMTHYLTNQLGYIKKQIKRIEAEYYATNRFQTSLTSDIEAVAIIHEELKRLTDQVRDYILAMARSGTPTFNSELSKHFGVYDTHTGNHQGWFMWEILNTYLNVWGFTKKRYSDFSDAEKQSFVGIPKKNVKYIVPIV